MNNLTKNEKINQFIWEIETYGATYQRLDVMRKLLNNDQNNDEPKKETKSNFDLNKSLEETFEIISNSSIDAGVGKDLIYGSKNIKAPKINKEYKFMDLLQPRIDKVLLTTPQRRSNLNVYPKLDGWYYIKDIFWNEQEKEVVILESLESLRRQISLKQDMYDYYTNNYIIIEDILLRP